MLPPNTCDHCAGRGWYETDPEGPDEGMERFCECTAGQMRREYDNGSDSAAALASKSSTELQRQNRWLASVD